MKILKPVALAAAFVVLVSCGVYSKPQKLDDYLYEIEYKEYDFEKLARFADRLFYGKKKLPAAPACSSVRCDSLFGRNFDWMYDEMPEFVIYTEASDGRYASLGVAAPICMLKDRQVTGLWGSYVLSKLPAFTVDGINEKGVACCVNITPQGDCGYTVGTNPGMPRLYSALLVRYLLDNASSAAHAVELIGTRDIYTSTAFGLKEDYHFMIADSSETYVVEFVDNKAVVLKDSMIMTNFNLAGGVTPHALGLERYDILKKGYDGAGSLYGMSELLKQVRFSRMYDPDISPQWFSELCSLNDNYGLTVDMIDSAPENFTKPMEDERAAYRNRSRKTAKSWHSVHTSIYNLNAGTLYLSTQESDRRHVFLFVPKIHCHP